MDALENADWPEFGLHSDVRPALRRAIEQRRDSVLVTVTGLEGSAPRPLGTQMLFTGAEVSGYLSGGCLEADVAHHAASALVDDAPRDLVYGRGSPWIDIRLTCGGRMELFVEPNRWDDTAITDLLRLEQSRRPALWCSDGRQRSVTEALGPPYATVGTARYTMLYQPSWRIVLVGGGPVLLALGKLGQQAGFEIAVVRPRGPSKPPPIDGSVYLRQEVNEAFAAIGIDSWTAVVSLSHDDTIDDEVAASALERGAGYVGVMGAARRAASRLGRLQARGVSGELLQRLASPAGAAQCGKSPWEVAVSIMAHVMEARTRAGGVAALLT